MPCHYFQNVALVNLYGVCNLRHHRLLSGGCQDLDYIAQAMHLVNAVA